MIKTQTAFELPCEELLFGISQKLNGYMYDTHKDFIVREISLDTSISELKRKPLSRIPDSKGNFVEMTLIKSGMSTFDAVTSLSDYLKISKEEIGYCGLKDTFGLTAQQITIPKKVFFQKFEQIHLISEHSGNAFFLTNPKIVCEPKKIRSLWGNNFEIKICDISEPKEFIYAKMNKISKQIRCTKLVNYYGPQRFGMRQNGHIIGKYVLRRDFENAVLDFLTFSQNENLELQDIRREIKKNWGDWKTCVNIIADNFELRHEFFVVSHLQENPLDFLGALNKTPLLRFFIDSYNSAVFNKLLTYLSSTNNQIVEEIKLPGYDANFDSQTREFILQTLAYDNITLDNYFFSELPSISCKAKMRKRFYTVTDFQYKLNLEENSVIVQFSLPMGTYASLFIDNFVNNLSRRKVKLC